MTKVANGTMALKVILYAWPPLEEGLMLQGWTVGDAMPDWGIDIKDGAVTTASFQFAQLHSKIVLV
jgi:hypothetical protein